MKTTDLHTKNNHSGQKEQRLRVVIQCMTYNHEPYIRDALEGFVMQQTNFPFVAIVHDDASTDGTDVIIREYAQKYPDIIKPIFETENQYSKKDGSLTRIVNKACYETGAKYIAFCEGDDYWTDPHKLQTQVDILDSHPNVSLCFHQVLQIHENTNIGIISKVEDRVYSAKEWYLKRPTQTSSYLCLANAFETELEQKVINLKFPAGDIATALVCASIGDLYGISKTMSVYRQVSSGWTKKKLSKEETLSRINHHNAFSIFGREIANASKIHYTRDCVQAFITSIKKHDITYQYLIMSLKKSIICTFKAILWKLQMHFKMNGL